MAKLKVNLLLSSAIVYALFYSQQTYAANKEQSWADCIAARDEWNTFTGSQQSSWCTESSSTAPTGFVTLTYYNGMPSKDFFYDKLCAIPSEKYIPDLHICRADPHCQAPEVLDNDTYLCRTLPACQDAPDNNVCAPSGTECAGASIVVKNVANCTTGSTGDTSGTGDTGATGTTGDTGGGGDSSNTGDTGGGGVTGGTGDTGGGGSSGTADGTGGTAGGGNTGGGSYTGNTGDTGYTGNTGNTGDTGYTGNTGDTGYTGNTGGDCGNTGDTGYTGNTGDTGYTGNTGGDCGNTGNTGDTSNTGCTGSSCDTTPGNPQGQTSGLGGFEPVPYTPGSGPGTSSPTGATFEPRELGGSGDTGFAPFEPFIDPPDEELGKWYTPTDDTYQEVIEQTADAVSSNPLFTFLPDAFGAEIPGGGECPTWTLPAVMGMDSYDIAPLCDSFFTAFFPMVAAVLIGSSAFMGLRIILMAFVG
ncbi:hypothetical protein [Methylovulum psychrotolerans]|uniref:Collagen-like protein n=1 Tax=Methylovulum psychrotolerans TaxID=1704499 RepID=A0A2S5CR42_9GAMM|nr:hypothetical protein [Methylovulum psychrotolerans]POZ53301.1 collagen-like protein [Methylovulum psychrotolerans]